MPLPVFLPAASLQWPISPYRPAKFSNFPIPNPFSAAINSTSTASQNKLNLSNSQLRTTNPLPRPKPQDSNRISHFIHHIIVYPTINRPCLRSRTPTPSRGTARSPAAPNPESWRSSTSPTPDCQHVSRRPIPGVVHEPVSCPPADPMPRWARRSSTSLRSRWHMLYGGRPRLRRPSRRRYRVSFLSL